MSQHSQRPSASHQEPPLKENSDISERSFVLWLAWLLAAAAACYAALAVHPIFNRAEVFFAESAREMRASGRLTTPFFLGTPFFDKPILTYWAILASFRLLGVSHFAARLPSILAALATVAVTGWGASRVWGRKAGLVAAAALATSNIFLYFATLAMSDIWLTLFCTTGAMLLFAGSRDAAHRNLDWWLASIALSLGVLTKGPLAVLLPISALVVYLALQGELRQLRLGPVIAGLLTAVVLTGGWAVMLWRQNGIYALDSIFVQQNLQRLTGSVDPMHRPLYFVPESLVLGFLPWTIVLPLVLVAAIRERNSGWHTTARAGELFAWCCIVVVTLLFWISRAQMDYYILPVMPACAVLVGSYLVRALERKELAPRTVVLSLAIAVLLGGAIAGGYAIYSGGTDLRHVWEFGLWVFLLGAAATFLLVRRKYGHALAAFVMAVCGAGVLSAAIDIPAYRRAVSFPDVVRQARQHSASAPLALSSELGRWRAELAFQTGGVPEVLDTPQQLADFLRGPGPRMAVVSDTWLGNVPPDLAGRVVVVDHSRTLTHGVPFSTFLDESRLDDAMTPFSVIVCSGVAPLDPPSIPPKS